MLVVQVLTVIGFFGLIFIQGKGLVQQKYYFDLIIVCIFYALAFFYAFGYASDWNMYNPLDFFIWLLEPIGIKLFVDILGI